MSSELNVYDEIERELSRAAAKHPWPPSLDIVHRVAIMVEEAGEAMRAALQFYHDGGNIAELRTELVQTGAMVVRCIESVDSGEMGGGRKNEAA